ncbi:hypothetical protein NL676_011688 [Syzygium grande]|nr:hypothetical protein NL676_011688 [Syzygium grande]
MSSASQRMIPSVVLKNSMFVLLPHEPRQYFSGFHDSVTGHRVTGGKSGYQLGDWILPDGCDFVTCAESSFEETLRNMKTRFSGTVGVSSDCSNG